jgi:hypothetical protein
MIAHNVEMQRKSGEVIEGWAAVLLAPLALPIALIAQMLPGKKTVDRTAEEVAGYLRDFLEATGGEWDWDEFECVPITDPELDALRIQAALAAPPRPDIPRLRKLLAQAQQIARARVSR